MNVELLYAFRAIAKVSRIEAQQKLQGEYLRQSYRTVLIEKLDKSFIARVLYFLELYRLFLFSALRLNITGQDERLMCLQTTRNQERQIQYIKSLFPKDDFVTLELLGKQKIQWCNFKYIKAYLAAFAVCMHYYKSFYKCHDYVDYKNNIILLGMYVFAKHLCRPYNPKAFLVANDHSPIPLGFAASARLYKIPLIYIQHAHITKDMPYLRCDLAVLDGHSAKDVYQEICPAGLPHIVYKGIEGKERKMNLEPLKAKQDLTVGVFLNVYEENNLISILKNLDDNPRINKIIIRGHPAFPVKINARLLPKSVVVSDASNSLWDDAANCDLILGGNSSVHLSVLKFGVPCLFYNAIDYIEDDDYGFIKQSIVFEVKDIANINFEDVIKFYKKKVWQDDFRYFDSSYLRSPAQINLNVKDAVLSLIGHNKND